MAFALIIVVFTFAAVVIVVIDSVQALNPVNLHFGQFPVCDNPPFKLGHLFLHATRACLWHT
jgi:hypothetical protein